MLEEKVVAALRAHGVAASTKENPKATGNRVLVLRLGGERHYASRGSAWSRTGYSRVVLGVTVVASTDQESYMLADEACDVIEDLVFDTTGIAKAESTGFSTVHVDKETITTFQVEFLEER